MRVAIFMLLAGVSLSQALVGAELESPNRAWDMTLAIDGQDIDLRVRAPTAATDACPVIIFSHGLGGSREGYWPLAEAWASAGFVVIQPSHPGSDTQTLKSAGVLGLGSAARQAMADPRHSGRATTPDHAPHRSDTYHSSAPHGFPRHLGCHPHRHRRPFIRRVDDARGGRYRVRHSRW